MRADAHDVNTVEQQAPPSRVGALRTTGFGTVVHARWGQIAARRVERRLARRRRLLATLGLNDPPHDPEQLRRTAHFLRPRESRALWLVYSVLLATGLLAAVVTAFRGARRQVSEIVDRARVLGDADSIAMATDAGQQLTMYAAVLFMTVLLALSAWAGFIWAWNATSMRIGGRDRNVGLASRSLLRAMRRPHDKWVLDRRRLLEAARRWAACARRAGMRREQIDTIVVAVSGSGARTPSGAAVIRQHIQGLAQVYDTGELLDGRIVMDQRSRTWAQLGRGVRNVGVASVPPIVAALIGLLVARILASGL